MIKAHQGLVKPPQFGQHNTTVAMHIREICLYLKGAIKAGQSIIQ